jgi:hypothetical protein
MILFSIIFHFTASRLNPKFAGVKILQYFIFIRDFLRPSINVDLARLSQAIAFPRVDTPAGSFDKKVELIFVSVKKDFPVLIDSIKYGQRSISRYRYGGTRVIVPDSQVADCQNLITQCGLVGVLVLPESTFVSEESFGKLKGVFSSRATWVLQQLLKVQAVMASDADASLIIDSDTLLLTQRPWFSETGTQLLTPSYEYHVPYYQFLNRLAISSNEPQFTFISHHMLMQRSELALTLDYINWQSEAEIVNYVCANADSRMSSSICIEYELYAQALLMRSPEKVHLGLWSNASASRFKINKILGSRLIIFLMRKSFHSISFHSWSQ